MKILVMSDSHSGLDLMRRSIEAIKPDAMIHLGDYYEDGVVMHEEFPHIPMYQVPGNCDRYRWGPDMTEILIDRIFGVDIYMTHGHRHQVKLVLSQLVLAAREAKVQVALYGHTHHADCWYDDGLWVMNPGSCAYHSGSVGLIEVEKGKVLDCRILREEDL